MKVKLSEIKKDDDVYPREKISHKTITSYIEAIRGGAEFPPVEVQRISDNGVTKLISLDGWHRIEAYREYNKNSDGAAIDEIETTYWKEEILDKSEHLEALRIRAVQNNLQHGDRLKERDLDYQCMRIVQDRPSDQLKGIITQLGEWFQRDQSTISKLENTNNLYTQRIASRNLQIYHLTTSGLTQDEVATRVGLKQPAISTIIKNMNSHFFNILDVGRQERKSMSQLSEQHNIREVLLWHRKFTEENTPDTERIIQFKYKVEKGRAIPEKYNVWYYSERDPRLGQVAKGNIPGQIVLNLLCYYTKPGDLVIDPMAGGGSTIDACLVMGRRWLAYDINPQREDIDKWDITSGIPENVKNADFVFLDPPYHDMVFETGSIAKFYDFLRILAERSKEMLKKGGTVAILIADMTEKGSYCLSGEAYHIFTDEGFEYLDHISAPMDPNVEHTPRKEGERRLVGRNRDLYVFGGR